MHNGNKNLPQDVIDSQHEVMQEFYTRYKKVRAMRDHLLEVEWDEYRIEQNYGTTLFYNAHRRLRRYEKEMRKLGELMFARLTTLDGNGGQGKWDPFWSWSVDEIADSFSKKYKQLV